jgi:hypothetical protein
MERLEHLFQLIVDTLIERDPARLHQPMPIATLRTEVVPYRAARTPLALDCAEDHDMLLLRLLSGEGDFVRLAEAQAVDAFQNEVVSVNPDFRVLDLFNDVDLTFDARALARALGSGPARAYRPPEEDLPQDNAPAVESLPPQVSTAEVGDDIIRETELEPASPEEEVPDLEPTPLIVEGHCAFCGGDLPDGRRVLFCPHCGQGLDTLRCASCGAELEQGWRHCITCGAEVV